MKLQFNRRELEVLLLAIEKGLVAYDISHPSYGEYQKGEYLTVMNKRRTFESAQRLVERELEKRGKK